MMKGVNDLPIHKRQLTSMNKCECESTLTIEKIGRGR